MSDIQVVLIDHTGTKQAEMDLPSDKRIGELLALMAMELGVDREPDPQTPWRRVSHWHVENVKSGSRLTEDASPETAGVNPGDRLRLLPEVAADFSPVESVELWDGRSFRDIAAIITVVFEERSIALALPRRGTVMDLAEYLQKRFATLPVSISLPVSFRLLHEGRGDFLKDEDLVAEVIGDQDVISLHEVIKIQEL